MRYVEACRFLHEPIKQGDYAVSRQMAVELLTAAASIAPFTEEEATALVRHMHPYTIPAGERFLIAEEQADNDFMMLILSCEVLVESHIAEGQTLTINVLHAGNWVGELALLDGSPRQADCRASDDGDVRCAIISRREFLSLLETEPYLIAKLTLLLANNISSALRDMHQKMCRYAEIRNAIRTEL